MANTPSLAPSNIASLDDAKTEIARLVSIINTLSNQQNSTHNSISSLLKDTVPLWKGVYNSPGNKRLERQFDSYNIRRGSDEEKNSINQAGRVLAENLREYETEENSYDRDDRKNNKHRRYWLRKQVAELKQKQASLLEGRDFYQFTLMNHNKASVLLNELGTKKKAEKTKKDDLEKKKNFLTPLKTEIDQAVKDYQYDSNITKDVNEKKLKDGIITLIDNKKGIQDSPFTDDEIEKIKDNLSVNIKIENNAIENIKMSIPTLDTNITNLTNEIGNTQRNITAFDQEIANLEQAKKEAENSTQQELVDKFGSMHPEYLVHLIKDRPDRDNIIEQGLQAIQNHYKELDDMIDKKVTELEALDEYDNASRGGKFYIDSKRIIGKVAGEVNQVMTGKVAPALWEGTKFATKALVVDGGGNLLKWMEKSDERKEAKWKTKDTIAGYKESIRKKNPGIIRTTAKGVGNLATFTGKLATDVALIAPLKAVAGASRIAVNAPVGLMKAITFGKADIPYADWQGPSWLSGSNKTDEKKQEEKKPG